MNLSIEKVAIKISTAELETMPNETLTQRDLTRTLSSIMLSTCRGW